MIQWALHHQHRSAISVFLVLFVLALVSYKLTKREPETLPPAIPVETTVTYLPALDNSGICATFDPAIDVLKMQNPRVKAAAKALVEHDRRQKVIDIKRLLEIDKCPLAGEFSVAFVPRPKYHPPE